MLWIVGFSIAIIVFIVVLRGPPRKFNSATNALLAEHVLRYIELVPENRTAQELKAEVLKVWRQSSAARVPDESIVKEFNDLPRTMQLNLLAKALASLGNLPMIGGIGREIWTPVERPLSVMPKPAHIEAVAARLKSTYGTDVTIPDRRFRMYEWGVSDGEQESSAPAAALSSVHSPVVDGTPVRAYACGEYRAVLLKEPKGIGPAEYLFALLVYSHQGSRACLCVTAERSMAAMFLQDLPAELRQDVGPEFGKSVFLGIFDGTGHANLGPSDDCTTLELFEKRALEEMSARLQLTANIEVVAENNGRGGT